jgi:hypothetical protein
MLAFEANIIVTWGHPPTSLEVGKGKERWDQEDPFAFAVKPQHARSVLARRKRNKAVVCTKIPFLYLHCIFRITLN